MACIYAEIRVCANSYMAIREMLQLGDICEKVTDYVASGSFAALKENVLITNEENYALMVKTADFANGFTKGLTYTDKHGYEFLHNSNLFGGELILSNIGSIGKVFKVPYLNRPMTLASNSVMLKTSDNTLRDYLYYFFLSPTGYKNLLSISSGTSMKKFNKTELKKLEVPIPEHDIQLHIVSTLDKLQSIITHRKQQLAKLDELVKARFVEMFGDPITNPLNWKKDKTEHHIDLLSGFPFKSEQYVDSGVNICGGLIIMPQRIEWDSCVHWATTKGYEEYLLAKDDIVMALDRPWITEGFKIALVDGEHLPALLIQRTARIRATDINQKYLYHCFINGGFDKHTNITGSLVPHISAKDIKSFEILLPPLDLQNQFAAFVQQTDKSKFVRKDQNR